MDIKEFVAKAIALWNDGDEHGYLALSDDNTRWSVPGGFGGTGPVFGRMLWSAWYDAFPDNHVTLSAVVGEGSEGAEESVFEGTHTGVLHGPAAALYSSTGEIPPTGRRVSLPYAAISRIRDDKWVSFRVYVDQAELLTQLGLMPVPALP